MMNKPTGFSVIAKFCAWARSRGVRVLATYPSIYKRPEYDRACARQTIRSIDQFFRSINVPTVGTAEEAFLPLSEFFDTGYHLTQEGAQRRTQRLLAQLAWASLEPVRTSGRLTQTADDLWAHAGKGSSLGAGKAVEKQP